MHRPVTGHKFEAGQVSGYRADIDGLRAIAVLSVVILHAFPSVLRSGFVGVDVFFVISGYLITSIIIDDLERERFSFAVFYSRRIKRIFPALIAVLVACLIGGWFLLLPDEYSLLGKHVAAAAGFVSNFALWHESNYFGAAADTKILLHLWSLGIEEQYYLIWPVVVWVAYRYGLRMRWLFSLLFIASLAYCVADTRSDPIGAFYSPLSRFWELGAGGLLSLEILRPLRATGAIGHHIGKFVRTIFFEGGRGGTEDSNYRCLLSVTGLSLIATSTVLITRQHEFPGWWALMPTVGTYLTILAGPTAWINRSILSSRALVSLGLISYPIYLWHWPLLSFARNVVGDTPSWPVRLGIVIASIFLAWVTYRLIERPVRFGIVRRSPTVPILVTCMCAITLAGAYVLLSLGVPGRLKDKEDYASYFSTSGHWQIEEAKIASQNQCNFYRWDNQTIPSIAPRAAIDPSCYTKKSKKSVLILGDSNASDLYIGLKDALPSDFSTLLIYSSGCRFGTFSEAQLRLNHCDYANYFALNHIKSDPPDLVLISSNNSYDVNDIRRYALELRKAGVNHILVLGQRPHWKPFLYKIVLKEYWSATPRYIPGHQDDELLALGYRFESQLSPEEPFEFVNEREPFCNQDGCLTFLGEDRREGLITFDTTHLRPFASKWLAEKQLVPLILKDVGS